MTPQTTDDESGPQSPDGEFVRLYTHYQRRLFLYILSQVGNPLVAEEVLQETNVVVWSKFKQFRAGTNFLAWVSQIANFEIMKHRTRKRREKIVFSDEFLQTVATTSLERSDELERRRTALSDCLKRLRPKDRELIEQTLCAGRAWNVTGRTDWASRQFGVPIAGPDPPRLAGMHRTANDAQGVAMNPRHVNPTELETLLEALCEDRITTDQAKRLEQLVLSSEAAQWKYLQYLDLHGTLYWDAAGVGSPVPLSSESLSGGAHVNKQPIAKPAPARRTARFAIAASVACVLLAVLVSIQVRSRASIPTNVATVNQNQQSQTPSFPISPKPARDFGPAVALSPAETPPTDSQSTVTKSTVASEPTAVATLDRESDVVASIDHEIQAGWMASNILSSALADDPEWCRRVYLDLLGRVPTLNEVESFLGDLSVRKRSTLIDRLLADTGCVRNLTTKFTNLLIGRVSNPLVDRAAFQKFLRTSFAENRPWNEIVADLLSAEGPNNENGATNFLIAHLNNDATPATAVASRVFLGRQLHCNQCHNNPFDETKQSDFWELNSFFQQTATRLHPQLSGPAGHPVTHVTDLVNQESGGPTYFETTNGLMKVAYPRFHGHDVDPGPEQNRRRELARLMTVGNQPELAAAFVNRMWEHFFGAAFTYRADDLGPHQPTSHPELFKFLSEQFVRSGYDVKQLMRWICLSNPYQLTSRFSSSNHADDPTRGELPAFSRMYVKYMTAEQAYDSFFDRDQSASGWFRRLDSG